jgi:hypothetical protein
MDIPALKWLTPIALLFCCAWTDLRAADRVPIHDLGWTARVCQPPKTLCGRIIRQLEQGGFLDFRASPDGQLTVPRLLSPFAVVRIDPLDRTRCPAKLCAAHLALATLQEDLLKQGYYTENIAVFPGSAVITLRTERIDSTMKVLKGSCRFNLDAGCSDSDTWLQDDHRSSEKCGFGQTRLFVAARTVPEFVGAESFAGTFAAQGALSGAESLRAVSFDAANIKVYELVYVHKICRSEMTIVRNG